MATTAVSVLEQRLAESIGDYIQVALTTAINADLLLVSTNLQALDGGRDDYFNDWWVYITDKANAAIHRQVADYATASGTLTIRGANLTDDGTDLATIRLHRYSRDKYITALNDTIRELFPALHRRLDVIELVTGNILPNSHFRDWTVSTVPDEYSLTNVTAAASTTAGTYRGGGKSAKVTATAANGYLSIKSDNYPRLLDLMDKNVSVYVWAYPEVADDATIVIYTKKASGTAQTLTSTTACPAGEFTLLKLEDQKLNDDLVEVEIRFKIATNLKYVYFDHARVIGGDVTEYLLPIDFRDGVISTVDVQSNGYSDRICDDLWPTSWEASYGWEEVDDGTDKYLRLPDLYYDERLIRLQGYAPLSTVSAYADTIEIAGESVNLFIAYAKYKLYQAIEGPVAVSDIGRYESQSAKSYNEYLRLRNRLSMVPPKFRMKIMSEY